MPAEPRYTIADIRRAAASQPGALRFVAELLVARLVGGQ